MQGVKEKVSNAAAAAQEHVDIMKAKAEEVAEKATATTKEERKMAVEKRKAKEAEAQMRHQAHAENAAERLREKHSRHALGHHDPAYGAQGQPVGTAVPTTGVPAPTYPLGGQPPVYHKK